MQPRKEHYRRKLPHFQQPGQWYSVTCSLAGAMPKGAMQKYSMEVEMARNRMEQAGVGLSGSDKISDLGKSDSCVARAKKHYQIALRKYRLAYDKILNKSVLPGISLIKEKNRKIIEEALQFWEGKRLTSHTWCIMPNHFHWVLSVFEKELEVGRKSDFPKSDNSNLRLGKSQSLEKRVYLQDILHSVKLYTARQINKNESRTGQLWENESFETTIRNDRHFVNVINYTLHNPVSAGLVKDWRDWPGTKIFGDTDFPNPCAPT